jgi:hypothetical protein
MARRHRSRSRARRGVDQTHRAVAPRSETGSAPAQRSATHRPTRAGRSGYSRAVGTPSASLEKAAVLERGFIAKDFRRLAIVIGVALALLVVSGVLESVLLRG